MKTKNIPSCLLGIAIGDALGVPVEFKSRKYLDDNPVTDFIGYGCWNQPPGTWSDDSSLTFCLVESFLNGYDLNDIAKKFILWYKEGYWGARYSVFDIGNTTRESLKRIIAGARPEFSGDFDEESNGNGSLMRIIPIALFFQNLDTDPLYLKVKEVSAITHGHFRSVFSCFILTVLAREILLGKSKEDAFDSTIRIVNDYLAVSNFNVEETHLFKRLLDLNFSRTPEEDIFSSGYVIDTLEASIWCFLTSNTFKETVLQAVNLGGDTDTTAAVAGGLAGLYYGMDGIPVHLIEGLARKNDVMNLGASFKMVIEFNNR